MNLINQILLNFFKKEMFETVVLVVSSVLVNVIQTNFISSVIANIIHLINHKGTSVSSIDKAEIMATFGTFVWLSLLFLFVLYIYKIYQNKLLTNLRQNIRFELTRVLLKENNENFSDKNFIKLNSPINRMSNMCFWFISDIISFIFPNIVFLVVICGYFTYHDWKMGGAFTLMNIIIVAYVYLNFPAIMEKNEKYENEVIDNEAYLMEILNNMDKIIYRGQTTDEIEKLEEKTNKTIQLSYEFYSFMNLNNMLLTGVVYFTVCVFIYYNIHRVFQKDISQVIFITFFTIIILYRDKMSLLIQQLTELVEFLGRANGVLNNFADITIPAFPSGAATDAANINGGFPPVKLTFDEIEFKNVSFKYKTKNTFVLENFNLKLKTDKKIIEITGNSGRGKSTFAKLLLKMYKDYTGTITIDGIDIREINPDYIRSNIIYINQNSKLFDRLIVENMLYGCNGDKREHCDGYLKHIMDNYPKIRELFTNNDIYSTRVGPLGEKMSGGQRVIISIITGLITPSIGLILDEPTVGLDGQLKAEVLHLIQEYKKHKKFIIIITHDKDVGRIVNEIYNI